MVQRMCRNTQSEVHRNLVSCMEIKFVSNGKILFNQILVLLEADKYGAGIERPSCPLHKKVRQNGFQWFCLHNKQNPYLNVLLAQERSNQPLRVLQFSGAIEEAASALSSRQCPERSLSSSVSQLEFLYSFIPLRQTTQSFVLLNLSSTMTTIL